jgi:integrase
VVSVVTDAMLPGTRAAADSAGLDLALELLEAEGRPPIAYRTPHTLRRTFASILAACDVPPRRAMYLLGRTDPKLTLAVYQQVLAIGKGTKRPPPRATRVLEA